MDIILKNRKITREGFETKYGQIKIPGLTDIEEMEEEEELEKQKRKAEEAKKNKKKLFKDEELLEDDEEGEEEEEAEAEDEDGSEEGPSNNGLRKVKVNSEVKKEGSELKNEDDEFFYNR
jgi:hypothetical protein